MERKTHTINAASKPLGRLATEIAILLRGKHKVEFAPYKDIGDFVVVENINNLKLTGNKLETKKYYHHTGYLGHLKETPLKKFIAEDPGGVLKEAVMGMLPKNRLRAKMIKRLKIE